MHVIFILLLYSKGRLLINTVLFLLSLLYYCLKGFIANRNIFINNICLIYDMSLLQEAMFKLLQELVKINYAIFMFLSGLFLNSWFLSFIEQPFKEIIFNLSIIRQFRCFLLLFTEHTLKPIKNHLINYKFQLCVYWIQSVT